MAATNQVGAIFLACMAMAAAGCVAQVDDSGTGPTDPAPTRENDGYHWQGEFPVEAMKISKEDFLKLADQSDIRLVSNEEYAIHIESTVHLVNPNPSPTPDAVEASAEQQISAMIQRYSDVPEAQLRLKRLAERPTPALVAQRAAAKHSFLGVTMPRKMQLMRMIQADTEVRDSKNGAAAYRMLYSRLPTRIQAQATTTPEQVDQMSTERAMAATHELATLALDNMPAVRAALPAARFHSASRQTYDCTGDEDFAQIPRSDFFGTGVRKGFSDLGLMKNFDFPVKKNLTCVKNQYARGSCVSFAATAALETEVAAQTGRFVNLSEQDIYSHAKNIWRVEETGDGSYGALMWDHLDAKGGKYFQPKEQVWAYNPAAWRVGYGIEGSGPYEHSCEGYPSSPVFEICTSLNPADAAACKIRLFNDASNCSETAGQARLKCADGFVDYDGTPYKMCGFAGPLRSGEGFRISGAVQLWDGKDVNKSMDTVIATLATGKAVFIGVAVPASIFAPDANGYLPYLGADEKILGGHALLAVGYVSNVELKAKFGDQVGSTIPLASGSGYLIIKNSWGPDYGDGGYMYMPTDWFKAYGGEASVLTGDIESSQMQ